MVKKEGIYVSINPHSQAAGGGANTFAWNFCQYLKKYSIIRAKSILSAKYAVIIANKVNYFALWMAKKTGCFIVHRLDEHFQKNEALHRKKKHLEIMRINKLADVTVFQSEFVRENVLPYLKAEKYAVIINGADPKIFYGQNNERKYIGHVTNSIGDKKRLDLLEKAVLKYKDEPFLFVGNHRQSEINFSQYPNITMVGSVTSGELVKYYQQMKCLYFPSENDPCPNTAVESVLCGVPVCYNRRGGTVEIVKDCGMALEDLEVLLKEIPRLRKKCLERKDLYFDRAMKQYLSDVMNYFIKEGENHDE